jgi:type IV pilus assembly protein PilE
MRNTRGFTIIEVMIVVVIVAILASVALPQYSDYVIRSKIQEATSALLAQRVRMEQYFQDNRTWTPGGGITLPCNPGTVAPLPTSQNFTFTCDNMGPNTYRVVATGNAGTSMNNFQFTINQFNQRVTTLVPAGWIARPNCWVLKRDGSC